MRTGNHLRVLRPLFYSFCAVLFLGGCSSSSDTTLSVLPGPGGGTHPADWASTHPSFAVSDVSECTTCHGDDLTGGIANTSCFTAACHHEDPGWASPAAHGAASKRAPGNSGFASCQICHASDFSGGGANVSCFLCHAPAPHPSRWRSGDTYSHSNADQGNAPVCAQCHLAGANSPIAPPSPPAPGGTPPGCFNSTLCHGSVSGHPSGWSNPDSHGSAARGAPSGSTGFASCQICHASDFSGGGANVSCFLCHAPAPHPSRWRSGDTYSHSNADQGNAPVCAQCHLAGANSPIAPPSPPAPGGTPPGCFNSTLCHGTAVSHLVPFLDPDHLGVDQAEFDVDCSFCHAVSGDSPVAPAPSCQVCHTAGSPLSPTGSFGVCDSCHGYPPDGAVGTYPNVAGAHLVHLSLDSLGAGTPVDCDTCHLGLGFVTQAHYDLANGRPGKGGRVPPGDLAFDTTYNAQSGDSSFDNTLNSLNCSNVSCHGGQTTPNFQTGTLDVNTQCRSCHADGTSQFNSYNSGRHNLDEHRSRACTDCHNTTTLAVNHFNALATQAMEGPASATIGGGATRVTSYSGGNCTTSCHENERWFGGD